MKVKAAVTLGYQQPFSIKDIQVSAPKRRSDGKNCRYRRLSYRLGDPR